MNSPGKPNSSYFGPRQRMSTRLKVANGLSVRKSRCRFTSKPMVKIDKECQKYQTNMKCMNLSKSNHNARVNVVTKGANTTSPKDSNICLSSALVAKNSKSGYVLASKHASQPTTLRLEKSLNPSSDFKCSKPSNARNALPLKVPKASASWKSKDDSNAIPRHLEQRRDTKTSRAISCRAHLKAMPNLIHKAKNVATSNLDDGALGSSQRGRSNAYNGEDINVGKEGTKNSKLLKNREVSRTSNIPVVDRMDPNKDEPNKAKGSQDEVVTKEEGMKGHTCEHRATCGNHHKHTNTTKTNDALNVKLPNRVQSIGGNENTNDVISRRRKRPLLEEKASTHVQKDLTCRPMKRRKYLEANEDEGNVGDQHPVHIEDVATELTPQVSISKHGVEQQCYCCSKPIDIPRWSGLFKIDGKEYISLAGHLSSKYCEKVWKLSSLPKVVQVTKVPRMAVWPKIFKASKPTGDNIGLYFFPPKMRHDEKLDQLVNEVMDKDLILQAVIGEAEMLMFPSVLLPERYQTFQKKHYLWAAFKAKEGKCDVIVEQEDEKEKHVSNQLDEVIISEEPDQEMVLMKSAMLLENQQFPAKRVEEVEGCCVQGPTNMWLEHESPEERRLGDSLHRVVCTTAASTAVANAATVPTEASSFTTDNASFPSNHGLICPSMEAPPQSSSVFGIVVRQAPNLEPEVKQFIQEMERKGALVSVMRGEATGGGPWPSNITTNM